MKEHEKVAVGKIKKYALQITQFKEGMSFLDFSKDIKTVSACVFNLSQIGELAGKLNIEFTEKHNDIPWRKIKGLRNKIVHDYEGIKLNIVWDVLNEFLPQLINDIDTLLVETTTLNYDKKY